MNSYLSTRGHLFFVLLGGAFAWGEYYFLLAFVMTVYFFTIWSLRKNETVTSSDDVVVFPCTGKIFHIKSGVKYLTWPYVSVEIIIKKRFFDGAGLYFPICAEVEKIIDLSKNKQSIIFLSPSDDRLILTISSNTRMEIFVEAGDRGKAGACLGVVYGNAEISLIFTSDKVILPYIGSRMLAGESIMQVKEGVAD